MTSKIKYRKYFKALEFALVILAVIFMTSKNPKYANYAVFSFAALWILISLENLYRINFYPDIKINKGGDISFIAMQPYILWYVTFGIKAFFKIDIMDKKIITALTICCFIILILSFIVVYNKFIKGNFVNFFNFKPKKAEIPELKKSTLKFILSVLTLIFAIILRIKGAVSVDSKIFMVFSYVIFIVSMAYYNGLLSREDRAKAKAQKAEPFLIGLGLFCLFIVNPVLFL